MGISRKNMGMKHRREYGLTADITLQTDPQHGFLTIHGVVQDGTNKRISAVLTKGAAHQLWYRLTQALYPDEAPTMTANASTAPLRGSNGELLTSTVDLEWLPNGMVEIIGTIMSAEWSISLRSTEAKRVWANLDMLLFPFGWEGRESQAPNVAKT